ncbi:MAG: hypothetical protein KDD70_03450 [Bdellovibrionales bacterium]|nr:hypothetical protein [Bdellovibrionales bacterium]
MAPKIPSIVRIKLDAGAAAIEYSILGALLMLAVLTSLELMGIHLLSASFGAVRSNIGFHCSGSTPNSHVIQDYWYTDPERLPKHCLTNASAS